jgi:sigma-B regulation protein RsbU (phosphoserine phosphatase)
MPYPYLVRRGEIERLTVSGVPLGLIEETRYDELEFRLDSGDLLILASDGATDALDPDGEMYEETRFQESIRRHAAAPIAACVQGLYRAIAEFTGNGDVHDDITILAIRRR